MSIWVNSKCLPKVLINWLGHNYACCLCNRLPAAAHSVFETTGMSLLSAAVYSVLSAGDGSNAAPRAPGGAYLTMGVGVCVLR